MSVIHCCLVCNIYAQMTTTPGYYMYMDIRRATFCVISVHVIMCATAVVIKYIKKCTFCSC